MRYPSYYPLLVTGLHTDESLSVDDCALIADALTLMQEHRAPTDILRDMRMTALIDLFRAAQFHLLTSAR
jgi:hypothetical protein